VWIAVQIGSLLNELLLFLEFPDDFLIGIFYKKPLEIEYLLRKLTFLINGAYYWYGGIF